MAADAATDVAARLPLADQDDESRRGPRYRPGTRLLVTFVEDPGIWHERIVLYQATLEAWAILTAHGHEYVEHGSWWTSVELLTGRAWSSSLGALDERGAPHRPDRAIRDAGWRG